MINNLFRRFHLDDDQLAGFIDGTCSDHDRDIAVKHLKSCSRCSEAYREAVLYKGLLLNGASDLETSDESIGLAKGVLARDRKKIGEDKQTERSFTRPTKYLRMIAVAASFVIVVTLGISYHFAGREGKPALDSTQITPIREAVELASMSGHMVIPGGGRLIDRVSETYRSGYIRINDSLRTALAYFSGEFQEDDTSREVVYWLLGGYVATGQVSAARDLASQAIKEFPNDIDIMIFDAIVSYMESDLDASERAFRRVLDREPGNPYAGLNLAILLYERGEEQEATDLLERIADEQSGSAFAARAELIIKEIEETTGSGS